MSLRRVRADWQSCYKGGLKGRGGGEEGGGRGEGREGERVSGFVGGKRKVEK